MKILMIILISIEIIVAAWLCSLDGGFIRGFTYAISNPLEGFYVWIPVIGIVSYFLTFSIDNKIIHSTVVGIFFLSFAFTLFSALGGVYAYSYSKAPSLNEPVSEEAKKATTDKSEALLSFIHKDYSRPIKQKEYEGYVISDESGLVEDFLR